MASRFDGRNVIVNQSEIYKDFLQKRGINQFRQFATPKLRYPTEEEIGKLQVIGHIWGHSDHYWKLAQQYYSEPDLWWIIAWYNQKPAEFMIKTGDVIFIPLPLDRILRYFDI